MKPQSKYLIVFNEEAIIADGHDLEEYDAFKKKQKNQNENKDKGVSR